MKLLVLGGSQFLSRATAQEALRRGHDVTCACRGVSGSVPEGATHVVWDRAEGGVPDALAEGGFDAVVDVARHPSYVRNAVAALPDAHWVFVSTINVYSDDTIPNGTPDTLPLHEPIHTDEDPMSAPETYGAMKVSCEQAVLEGAASAVVVRPGLIVGPGDPTGRFSYWPARLAEAGEVIAPGSPDDAVQVVDVRDLAAWLVDLAETRTTGVFDGTSHVMTRRELLDGVAAGLGAEPTLTWVDQEFLAAQEVEPWAGDRAIPVWLPLPEYAGLLAHDVTASYDAGLRTRPVADTARDTLAWLREHPDATVTGISREDEAAALAAWHARPG
jgi:nucleoside-diphosphate-sugar epimerase